MLRLYIHPAGLVEALQTASLVDEFGIDVFVDAGEAESVPAAKEGNEHITIKSLIKFSIASLAKHYVRPIVSEIPFILFLNRGFLVGFGIFHFQLDHSQYITIVFNVYTAALGGL